ncbi:MAG: DUF2927 domain-containing protein [Pseudomonadota bacterium]
MFLKCFDARRQVLRLVVCALSVGATVTGFAQPADAGMERFAWLAYEQTLIRTGHLRTERAPDDAPFSNADVLRNFREVIFYDEYVRTPEGYVDRRTPRRLEKRSGRVTYTLWGGGVTSVDHEHMTEMVDRVARATGLEIVEVAKGAQIEVLILNAEGRHKLAGKLEQAGAKAMAYDLRNDLDGLVCAAYFFPPVERDAGIDYTIIIPDELSPLLRRSCIEEEFGQAFGPSADFAGARPSVFNDDEEFALFTEHDALLFKVLYDARLQAGMSEREAMPIVERILTELRPEG